MEPGEKTITRYVDAHGKIVDTISEGISEATVVVFYWEIC